MLNRINSTIVVSKLRGKPMFLRQLLSISCHLRSQRSHVLHQLLLIIDYQISLELYLFQLVEDIIGNFDLCICRCQRFPRMLFKSLVDITQKHAFTKSSFQVSRNLIIDIILILEMHTVYQFCLSLSQGTVTSVALIYASNVKKRVGNAL